MDRYFDSSGGRTTTHPKIWAKLLKDGIVKQLKVVSEENEAESLEKLLDRLPQWRMTALVVL